MTDLPMPAALEALLAEESFLRALARELLGDAARAEDVVQMTYVAALRHPPAPETVRGWLRTVVRRFADRARRAELARRHREEQAARPEAVPSTAELMEREATRRELLDVLLGLPAPYRNVLLLRFYEALPPREIARRLGLSNGTVRSQVSRGLALMRERLDRRHGGDGRSWCLALIPLATAGGRNAAAVAAATFSLAGLLMHKATLVVLATALLLLAGTVPLAWGDPGPPATPARGATPEEGRMRRTSGAGERTPTDQRIAVDTERRTPPGELPADRRAGRLLHEDGAPVRGVRYWVERVRSLPRRSGIGWGRRRGLPEPPGAPEATGADGGFAWPERPSSGDGLRVLWFELTPNCRAGYDVRALPGDGVLRTPGLAPIRVHCLGIGPEERWQVGLSPVARKADAPDRWEPGDLGVLLAEPEPAGEGRPALLLCGTRQIRATGPGPVDLTVLRQVPFLTTASGEGFRVRAGEPDVFGGYVRAAPGELRLTVTRRHPVIPFEVLEADGATPSEVALTVQVILGATRTYTAHLRGPDAVLGQLALRRGSTYRCIVLLEDGELFAPSFTVPAVGPCAAVRLVRGRGEAPARFAAAGAAPLEPEDLVYLEDDEGVLQPGPGGQMDFVIGKTGVFRVAAGGRSFFLHSPRDRRRGGVVVKRNGLVGDFTWPLQGGEGTLRWRAARSLGVVRTQDVYRRLIGKDEPADGELVRFEFELQLSRSDGGPQWVRADSFTLKVGQELLLDPRHEAWPVWQKVVPDAVPYRMVFWRGSAEPVEFRVR